MSESSSKGTWALESPPNVLGNNIDKVSCPSDDIINKLKPWRVVVNQQEKTIKRTFFVYFPPQLCSSFKSGRIVDSSGGNNSTLISSKRSGSSNNIDTTYNNKKSSSLRIILGIHGYGGRPFGEIRKWQSVAVALNAIIIAPEGTVTPSDHNKLGWNGIHCCGDPVMNGIDDVDFIVNGSVEIFLQSYFGKDYHQKNNNGDVHVIATGFSNGGFMSSLMGLLPMNERPSWLVGIVPTGGYQYDIEMYGEGTTTHKPSPLPMMSHHGGKDSAVIPTGCCASSLTPSPDKSSKSNCYFDIGIKQETCTSVQSAFEMWSHINGCSSTMLDEGTTNNNGNGNNQRDLKKVDNDKDEAIPKYTCWKGKDCIEPTNFCMWNNEGHAWGFQMPGVDMTQSWMEDVFHRAEERQRISSSNVMKDTPIDPSDLKSFNFHHSKKGQMFFSATFFFVAVVVFILFMPQNKMMHCSMNKRKKRKTSGDNLGNNDIALDNLVV